MALGQNEAATEAKQRCVYTAHYACTHTCIDIYRVNPRKASVEAKERYVLITQSINIHRVNLIYIYIRTCICIFMYLYT